MMMEVMELQDVKSSSLKSSPSTNQHPLFAVWIPFLSPNQQCQSTERKYPLLHNPTNSVKALKGNIDLSTMQPTVSKE